MAKSPFRDRHCLYCSGPIWYNTFLMEWFHEQWMHADSGLACPSDTGPTPAPIKRTRSPKE